MCHSGSYVCHQVIWCDSVFTCQDCTEVIENHLYVNGIHISVILILSPYVKFTCVILVYMDVTVHHICEILIRGLVFMCQNHVGVIGIHTDVNHFTSVWIAFTSVWIAFTSVWFTFLGSSIRNSWPSPCANMRVYMVL
jgi:hypothetical protein